MTLLDDICRAFQLLHLQPLALAWRAFTISFSTPTPHSIIPKLASSPHCCT